MPALYGPVEESGLVSKDEGIDMMLKSFPSDTWADEHLAASEIRESSRNSSYRLHFARWAAFGTLPAYLSPY